MQLIHLSDLHLHNGIIKINIKKTEYVLERIIETGFDHLVITGDITHYADKESFLIFRDILKNYGLLNSRLTSLVIGNHDIYGGVHSVKELLEFPDKCKFTDYDKKVMEFKDYFEELFTDCFFPSSESLFPYAKEVSDFVLIGLNTNDKYSILRNPFASNGKVTKLEFDNLLEIFNNTMFKEKPKIIMAHHHFYKNNYEAKSSTNELWNKIEGYTLKLRGKKKLIKAFKKNKVTLVLHGHSHQNRHYKRMGINFSNAGGCIDNENEFSYLTKIVLSENNLSIEEIELDYENKFEFAIGF